MARGANSWFFAMFLIFGIYLINKTFSFVAMPEFIVGIDEWINFIAGILLVFGGINYLRIKRIVT